MTATTYVTIEVPGVGVVHGAVSWAPQTGAWNGDETLSNLPGLARFFSLLDKEHSLSVTSRVIRAAREARRT